MKCSEEANWLKRKDSVEKLISSLQKAAPLVPAFGGVVSAVLGGLASEHRFKRLADFIMKLAIEINRIDHASEEYIRSEGFGDIFYQILLKVNQEGLEEKRVLLGRFLKNAVDRLIVL